MTVGLNLWLGCSRRGRALDVTFFLALSFVGAMLMICWEFSRIEGLQVTSNVIDSWDRIAVGTSFHWIHGEPIEGEHSICTTQHPQMMQ